MNGAPTSVPDWRPNAIYHRVLTDDDGLVTGDELAVYPQPSGDAWLCRGPIATTLYDHAWIFESAGEAIFAADEFEGGFPDAPGTWRHYLSRANGDLIDPIGTPSRKERADVVNALVQQHFPDMARAFRQAGENAADAAESFARWDIP